MASAKTSASVLGALLMIAAINGVGDAAAEETRRLGPFDADHVRLQSFAADLRVVPGDSIGLVLKGSPKTIEAIEVSQSGTNLTVTQPPTQVSTVVMGPGAVITNHGGSITIGGNPVGSLDDNEDFFVELTLPRTTSLAIADFVGNGSVPDLEAPLDVVLTSGRIDVGSVGPATLEIPGSGTITVKAVSRQLSVSIPGSGSVRVEAGDVGDLKVEIAGSGDVTYGGIAEHASIGVFGAGDVTLGNVANRPEVTMAGSGTVEIANW